jgi:16S rRNA G527 N7-methylase RsmG
MKGGASMAVISKPHSARVSLVDSQRKSLQTISRLKTNLTLDRLQTLFSAINNVRVVSNRAVGGIYTAMEELSESN